MQELIERIRAARDDASLDEVFDGRPSDELACCSGSTAVNG